MAFKSNNYEFAELLLKNGADPSLSKLNYLCIIFYDILLLDRFSKFAVEKCIDLIKLYNISMYLDMLMNTIIPYCKIYIIMLLIINILWVRNYLL